MNLKDARPAAMPARATVDMAVAEAISSNANAQCLTLFAALAARTARFRSSPEMIARSIVAIVFPAKDKKSVANCNKC